MCIQDMIAMMPRPGLTHEQASSMVESRKREMTAPAAIAAPAEPSAGVTAATSESVGPGILSFSLAFPLLGRRASDDIAAPCCMV